MHYLIHDIPKTDRKVFDQNASIEKNFAIMRVLGNPEKATPTVHVAGTSGKGTICYLIDGVLRAHSKTTGLTLSPHVYDIRERIQINGQLISEKSFMKSLNTVLNKTQPADIHPSYFETLIAMAYLKFAESKLDYAIVETGFGGRLDATNVVVDRRKVCVLSRIGLEHTEALGDTIEKIAFEKAGIIQEGSHVIALHQEPEVNAVFAAVAKEKNASLTWIKQTGDYQLTNNALAQAACEYLAHRDGWQHDMTLADTVFQQVFIPGRFEKRHLKDHLVILDGAHNPQKLSAVCNRVKRENKAPVTVVLAMGERKDIRSCLEILKPIAKRIIATEYFSKEKDIPVHPINKEVIVRLCNELGIEVHSHQSPKNALDHAAMFAEPILITGSFYLLGEVDKYFTN